eukprot:2090-Heterococcus_DN1.PRE.2
MSIRTTALPLHSVLALRLSQATSMHTALLCPRLACLFKAVNMTVLQTIIAACDRCRPLSVVEQLVKLNALKLLQRATRALP